MATQSFAENSSTESTKIRFRASPRRKEKTVFHFTTFIPKLRDEGGGSYLTLNCFLFYRLYVLINPEKVIRIILAFDIYQPIIIMPVACLYSFLSLIHHKI